VTLVRNQKEMTINVTLEGKPAGRMRQAIDVTAL
jgi:hypothetical protein